MSLRKKTVVAAKLETTLGTAESLAATDAQFIAYDFAYTLNGEDGTRDAPGSLTKLYSLIGPRSYDMTFKVELSPDSGWAAVFLPACSMKDTAGVFSLLSGMPVASAGSPRTITIGGFMDGRKVTASGCMGNVKFVYPSGKRPYADFSFKGKYVALSDATLIAPTLPSAAALRAANMTFTLAGAIPGKTNQVEVDLQNEVTLGEDLGSLGADAGYCYARVVDRNPMITAALEQQLVATNDLHGKWAAHTLEAFILAIGSGSTVTINAPAAQVVGIADGERDGVSTDTVTWGCKQGSAIEDELTVTLVSV